MANLTFEEQLWQAVAELRGLILLDTETPEGGQRADAATPDADGLGTTYVMYLQVYRKLEECYDQILQPQKRADIRLILDSCMGRFLEVKNQLVENFGEYTDLSGVLHRLGLAPDDLEVPIPRYFLDERRQELEERSKLLDALLLQYGRKASLPGDEDGGQEVPLTREGAVALLQACERARQARQRARFLKEIRDQEEWERQMLVRLGVLDPQLAATKVQKVFRGHQARRRVFVMRQDELEFLGMVETRVAHKAERRRQLDAVLAARKMTQGQNLREMEEEQRALRRRVRESEGQRMMEDMHDALLEGIISRQQTMGKSKGVARLKASLDTDPDAPAEPPAPSADSAGESKTILPALKAAGSKPSGRKVKRGAVGSGASARDGERPMPSPPPASKFVGLCGEACQRYLRTWRGRFDPGDFRQTFDASLLREGVINGPQGLGTELRAVVDALVRAEVANMRVAREREGPPRPSTAAKPGASKARDATPTDSRKDPLEGRKIETLMSELVWAGFLRPCPPVRLKDFIGASHVMGRVLQEAEKANAARIEDVHRRWRQALDSWTPEVESSLPITREQLRGLFERWAAPRRGARFDPPGPSMADLRHAAAAYAILPLGSKVVHDSAPHPTALLLYGPAGSGKTFLTHAIATEAGANLFDLSPAILQDKYSSPKAATMLMQMVFKVAKAMAPSVVYIDEVDLVFRDGQGRRRADSGAARIRRDLVAQVKALRPEDRVMVVGNSRHPFDANVAELTAFFGRMLYCGLPDYPSRLRLWRTLLRAKGAQLPNSYDEEILAYISDSYSSGAIHRAVEAALNPQRSKWLARKRLQAEEFLAPLSTATAVSREELERLQDFTLQLPSSMRKRREGDAPVEDVKRRDGRRRPAA